MEPHYGKPPNGDEYFSGWSRSVEDIFADAFSYACDYHSQELETYRASRDPEETTPHFFWSEYIWCVYVSGFNAKTITRYHPLLMNAFGPWDWTQPASFVRGRALKIFGNERKCDAVLKCRELIRNCGWHQFKDEYLQSPESIRRLPFMGPATSMHLARNLGFDYVKPDVHLIRLAEHFDFEGPESMCAFLSGLSGERLGVVDFIFWAYCAAFGTRGLK